MATTSVLSVAGAPSFAGDFNKRLPVARHENWCRFDSKFPRNEIFWTRRTSVLRLDKRRVFHSRRNVVPRNSVPAKEADVVIPKRSVSVILLAGGKGTRMGANMPKQYLPLLGRPVALYSFQTFADMEEVEEIVVVCDPTYRDLFKDAQGKVELKFAIPGKERQDSVWSGLQQISKASKLACIHDCARPLVETTDIRKVLRDAWTTGAAVLGVPCKATIKEAGEGRLVSRTLDRSTLWEMQTPQVIEPQLLHRGYELVEREGYAVTDDVSIVEYLKHPVLITQGSYTNLKITTRDDLMVAERILQSAAA